MKLLDLLTTQLDTYTTKNEGLGSKGTNNIGNILNSIVESQTVPSLDQSQHVLNDNTVSQQLRTTVSSFFDSIQKNQIAGENVSIVRNNLNLVVSKVTSDSLSGIKLNCTNSSTQSPVITVPTLGIPHHFS
jgi:hypothetical protein